MLFVAGGLTLIISLTVAFVGIADARTRLRRFETEMETTFPAMGHHLSTENTSPADLTPEQTDTKEATCFSSSLLSAIKVHSQMQHNAPEVVSEETKVSVE